MYYYFINTNMYWCQAIVQSILFALGHLGNPFQLYELKRMIFDIKFWRFKFPVMIIMGYVYFHIAFIYGKLVTKIVHLTWDTLIILLHDRFDHRSVSEKQVTYWTDLADHYKVHPFPSETEEDNHIYQQFNDELDEFTRYITTST